ncbi:hypothetical protein DH2020_035744 [Rehmannia glutinosa]|uniref:CW-type domain-containing protein n=1 Tax=Rehmannia glutinosa TaxID=99300 RepID=A0ABR0V860_REHGL
MVVIKETRFNVYWGIFRKILRGGVTAENLGAKFGGYGSFLPTHQRSPSIWSQPKSPQRVHNSHSPRSPNVCPEGPTPNSAMVPDPPSTQRGGISSSSPSMRTSQTLKTTPFDNASVRQKATVCSDKVGEVFPPSSKGVNPPDQRTLKVRIKVGPERVAQYNAEIYNLGLTSPSSSEGNSHDESDGLFIESHETPNESPANILKIMTSFPVAGGLLLSPLCEDLLNLARETENSLQSKCEAAPRSSATSVRLLNNHSFGGKKTKFVDKSRNIDKSDDEVIVNHNDCKQRPLGGENLECSVQPFHEMNCKPLPDTVRETERDVQVKKRKGSKDRVKDRAVSGDSPESRRSSVDKIGEHRSRISPKDVSVDHGQGSKNRVEGNRASFKAYSDNSEGEGVKRTMDNSTLKVGPTSTSNEHNGFGVPHAANRLSFEGEQRSQGSLTSGKLASKADGLRDGGCAASDDKHSGKKDVRRLHLSKKDAFHTSLEHVENPKRFPEMPSGDKPKNLNLDAVKAKSAHADKLKERSSSKKKYLDKVPYDTHIAEPQAAPIHSKEGILSGEEQTVAAPVVIQEDWVACDRCQQWRLLPYGTKSEHLPDKWVCSMLDWLPGMNRCDISEDETTKALHASYLVPLPENQLSFQAHADGTMAGVNSASAHHFNQNHSNCASGQMKKQKQRENRNAINMRDSVPSNGKKQLQRLAVRNESSKVVKQPLGGVNATNKPDMQHSNKSTVVSGKPNKRKGEHVIGVTVDNFQTSGGNVGGMMSGLTNKAAIKEGKKKSVQKDAISGGDFRISVKKHTDQMQDLPDSGPLGMKPCNGSEVSIKKIKLKDYDYSPGQVEKRQINGRNLEDRKVFVKEDSKDGDFHREKKPRMSQIEEDELKRCPSDTSKRKSAEARFQSSGSKEYPINRGTEKEPQVRKSRAKPKLTIEDIDKLKQDLGCEQLSTAATSSSSKVSGSRKNRISYMEVKGSPEESVSSSPARMPYPNQVSPMVEETVRKVDPRFNDVPAIGSMKEIRDMNESSELAIARKGTSGLTNDNGSEIFNSKNILKEETDLDNHSAQKHEVSSNVRHPFSDGSSLKPVKKGTSVGKKDLGKSGVLPRSNIEQISAQTEPWSGKLRIDLRQGDKQGALCRSKHASGLGSTKRSSMDSRTLDASVVGDTSKALKETAIACPQNVTDNFINNEEEQSLDPSLGNKNVCAITASTTLKEAEDALREAEELKIHADLIKNSGFSSESNYEYFKAALKFLHGASLLETCNGESTKHLEMSPMQMYGAAAQLCKTCAFEYEKSHEMAAAALAYKCVEVGYLRVVYCKSSNTSRVWHDLQSSLQMVPQGESPSSSASDVDNLNNLVMTDKATLSKGCGSLAGNHVIVPRNRLNFVRLLDFTKDVNSAMEAAKKSQDTFAAARVELEKSQNKEAIISVKKVIDLSFQNVEELVRLVWLAFNTVNHQRLNGSRE